MTLSTAIPGPPPSFSLHVYSWRLSVFDSPAPLRLRRQTQTISYTSATARSRNNRIVSAPLRLKNAEKPSFDWASCIILLLHAPHSWP